MRGGEEGKGEYRVVAVAASDDEEGEEDEWEWGEEGKREEEGVEMGRIGVERG